MLRSSLYQSKNILGNGFVRLVDHMPKEVSAPLFCDAAVPQMARISYGAGTKEVQNDEGLIRYLMRHHHTSPFEAVEFKFHLKIPIFVERQLIRHRTANVNQMSGRYSVLPDEYYEPDKIRLQSRTNKQGSSEEASYLNPSVNAYFRELCRNEAGHTFYQELIDKYNVSRELARIILPQNIMTELYWKIDLHNLLHFLYLRDSSHAQQEIRDVAKAIGDIVKELCPISHQAFLDYRVNSMTLSAQEVEMISQRKPKEKELSFSKRERKEYKKKLERLGLLSILRQQ